MTSEAMKIIAEAEGVRTPTRKRSKKEVETTINEFTEKRKASKSKAKAAKSAAHLGDVPENEDRDKESIPLRNQSL